MEAIAEDIARALEQSLRALANSERATQEQRYLKSELEFIGVGVPGTRRVVRALAKERGPFERAALLDLVRSLWARPVHELRLAAVELLAMRQRLLQPADLPLFEALLRECRGWALLDAIATGPLAHLVEAHPELGADLDRWSEDSDFWLRRASLLALLPALRRGEGDWERFARYADAMLEEREFFIRKAIGWVLRETSKRRPALVYEWLAPRARRASGVTLREAVKYLPPDQREALMRTYGSG